MQVGNDPDSTPDECAPWHHPSGSETMKIDAKRFGSKLLFLAIDVAAYNVALWIAIWMRGWFASRDMVHRYFMAYYDLNKVMILLPVLFFVVGGLYKRRWINSRIEDLMVIIRSVALLTVGMLAVLYFLRIDMQASVFPLAALPIGFFTASTLICGWRKVVQWVVHRELGTGMDPRRTLLVGPMGLDPEIVTRIARNTMPVYHLVGCLEDKVAGDKQRVMGMTRFGGVAEFVPVVTRENIESVILVSSEVDNTQKLEMIHHCDVNGIDYQVIPSLQDMVTCSTNISLVNYVPMLHYGKPVIAGWAALFKRMFDIVASAAGLLVLSPLFAITALAIRLDSKGPAVFKQWRVGKDGHRFRIYKFRTMCNDAEKKGALTEDNDPRITRLGRLLRKTSIDELPQLVNVLLGQMSLVGPRAVVPFVADKFSELERLSLNVQPGLTGLAQVSGRDALGFYDKSLLNLYYIRNYSFLLDMKIIFKTFQVVLLAEGTEGTKITS